MATLLQVIGDIVRPVLRQDGLVRLEESAPGATFEPVTLTKHGPALVLKVDDPERIACPKPDCPIRLTVNDRMFPLFRVDAEGVTAVCDYLLFHQAEDDAPLFIFCCELKSGDPRPGRRQTENGRLMADYILAMAVHHGRLQRLPEVRRRGLIFSPRCDLPTIRNPAKDRFRYADPLPHMPDMRFAYLRDRASYPLSYFCA
jgi:hypothetical protein